MFKKILSLLLIGIFIGEFSFFSISNAGVGCGTVRGFSLYNCRVDDICKKYNTGKRIKTDLENKDEVFVNTAIKNSDSDANDVHISVNYLTPKEYYKDEELVKKFKGYPYSDLPFLVATRTYKENMNGIYRCAILFSKRKALDEVEKIINIDTSGTLAKKTEKKLKQQIKDVNKKLIEDERKNIDESIEKLKGKCSKVNYKMISRINILNEVTYETCKYRMYMDFLKEDYYKHNIKNLLVRPEGEKIKPIQGSNLGYKYNDKLTEIDKQIDHSYLVFQRAYEEYTAFESNYTMHILLQLLKDTYIVYRERLHNVLTPINQVVYKIKNAMVMQ